MKFILLHPHPSDIWMDVEGKRRKGRPKQKWVDSVNVNLRVKGLLD